MSLLVLWEDRLQVGTKPAQYGPHGLLAAALTDHLAFDDDWYPQLHALRSRVLSNPCGGIGNLVGRLADSKIYARAHHVLAIYDEDQIRTFLGLPADPQRTPQRAIVDALRGRAADQQRCTPLPIGANLESLIEVLSSSAVGGQCTPDELAVIARKTSGGEAHRQRDRILLRHSGIGQRAIRTKLAAASTEWAAIVEAALAVIRSG